MEDEGALTDQEESRRRRLRHALDQMMAAIPQGRGVAEMGNGFSGRPTVRVRRLILASQPDADPNRKLGVPDCYEALRILHWR